MFDAALHVFILKADSRLENASINDGRVEGCDLDSDYTCSMYLVGKSAVGQADTQLGK